MQTDIELEAIFKGLATWRETRKNVNSKIPEPFLEPIRNLALRHKKSFIAKTLCLSLNTVSKILKSSSEQMDFVELSTEPTLGVKSTISCTLQRPDGVKLIMETQSQQIVDLMQAFLCCK